MKYYIAVTMSGLIGLGLWLNQESAKPIKPKSIFSESKAPAPALDPASAAAKLGIEPGPTQLQEISKKIDELSEKAAILEHELRVIGYPKVMLDDRLTEAEKTDIVNTVMSASALHNQIALLKIRRIDLKAEL